ncbi:hypothetical protein ACN47E_003844 [Coniothyrium glycines]
MITQLADVICENEEESGVRHSKSTSRLRLKWMVWCTHVADALAGGSNHIKGESFREFLDLRRHRFEEASKGLIAVVVEFLLARAYIVFNQGRKKEREESVDDKSTEPSTREASAEGIGAISAHTTGRSSPLQPVSRQSKTSFSEASSGASPLSLLLNPATTELSTGEQTTAIRDAAATGESRSPTLLGSKRKLGSTGTPNREIRKRLRSDADPLLASSPLKPPSCLDASAQGASHTSPIP